METVETLPSLALLNIFINLNFKDRFGSIPLVCKEWNSIISNDPRCWSSMIPDSISPDNAFIKKPDYSFQLDPPSKLSDREGQEIVRDTGVSYLRNFIKKSSCSSSSTITSLCLDPFHFSYPDTYNETRHHDEILRLIAHCCPNLKRISFDGFYCASREALLELFKRCKKIELIDFSDSGYADSCYAYPVQVIEELEKCLPNLRGIRIAGWIENVSIYGVIATHLPRIKLLALDFRSCYEYNFRKLTSETKCRLTELQYLSVGLWEIDSDSPPVCTHIPEFHYEKLLGYKCDFGDFEFQPLRSVHQSKDRPRPYTSKKQVCHTCLSHKEENEAKEKAKTKAKEAYSECSIMKQKKEYEVGSYIPPQDKIQMRRPVRPHVFRQPSQVSRPYQPQGIPTRSPTQMFRQPSQVSRPYQPQGIPTRSPTQVFRRPSKVSRRSRPYQPQGRPTRSPTQVFRPPSQVVRPYQPQGRPTRLPSQVVRPYQPQGGRPIWQAKCTPIRAPSPRGMRATPPQHMREPPIHSMRAAPPQHMREPPIHSMRAAPPQHMRAPPIHSMRAIPPQHVRASPIHSMRATPPQYMRAPQHMMSPPQAMTPPPFGSMRPPPMRSNTMANNFPMNNSYARWPEPQHGYGMNEIRSSYDGSQHGSSYNCNTHPQG